MLIVAMSQRVVPSPSLRLRPSLERVLDRAVRRLIYREARSVTSKLIVVATLARRIFRSIEFCPDFTTAYKWY